MALRVGTPGISAMRRFVLTVPPEPELEATFFFSSGTKILNLNLQNKKIEINNNSHVQRHKLTRKSTNSKNNILKHFKNYFLRILKNFTNIIIF